MRAFTVHTGTVVPLRRSDVDTDQIIPGRFCATHTRSGYADGLFGDWRAEPGFVLNRQAHRGATILVAGENFGTGSSREHAVWALRDYGFHVVLAPRFGDIFRANSLMAGLLTVPVRQDVADELWDAADADPALAVTVDLRQQRVTWRDRVEEFTLDEDTRARLLDGLDPIDATLRHLDAIAGYERRRRPHLPMSTTAAVAPL